MLVGLIGAGWRWLHLPRLQQQLGQAAAEHLRCLRRRVTDSPPMHCGTPRCTACRDRRYEYKGLTKVWKGKLEEAKVSAGGGWPVALVPEGS
jgi:hypothetical protein